MDVRDKLVRRWRHCTVCFTFEIESVKQMLKLKSDFLYICHCILSINTRVQVISFVTALLVLQTLSVDCAFGEEPRKS